MNLNELKKRIDEKLKLSIDLHKQLNNLNQELSILRNQYNILELEEFVNYLQIGEVIELTNYYSFSGYYCKDSKYSNSFQSGDKIKILKKNKKSIVIEVVKKIQRKWDNNKNISVITGETNPGWNVRINLDSFYHFYLKGKTNRAAFDSYIKRKHLLDSLFDE